MNNDDDRPTLHPAAISVEDLARLLTKVGGQHVSVELIRADVASGVPVNPDGTLNLVHYAAWLVKGMGRGD